jgi:hypothetical protein
LAPDLGFDGVEGADPVEGFLGDGRTVGLVHVEELAADVGPASGLGDPPAFIQAVEAGVAIGMQDSGEASQVGDGTFAAAIGRVAEQRGRRSVASKGALVADVGPQPSGPRPPGTGRQHRDRGVVGMQHRRAQQISLQRLQQGP